MSPRACTSSRSRSTTVRNARSSGARRPGQRSALLFEGGKPLAARCQLCLHLADDFAGPTAEVTRHHQWAAGAVAVTV